MLHFVGTGDAGTTVKRTGQKGDGTAGALTAQSSLLSGMALFGRVADSFPSKIRTCTPPVP
jgi:hypothetical protein